MRWLTAKAPAWLATISLVGYFTFSIGLHNMIRRLAVDVAKAVHVLRP